MSFHNEDDWPVDEYTVKSISVHDAGGFTVSTTESSGFGVTAEEAEVAGTVPAPGMKIYLLGGFGFPIRGIFIGGVEYRYKTREQAERERREWLAEYEAKKENNFRNNIGKWLDRMEQLDQPFQQRIRRFEDKGFKEFWKESGEYELFVVERANKLYNFAMTQEDPVQWINEFYNADWKVQKVMFPELDEGHSGNTFGGMVGLARAVAQGKQI